MPRIRAKPIGKPITPPIQEDEYGDLSISGTKIKDATIDHATKLTNVLPDQHHKKTTDASEITSGRFTMARMPDGTAGYYLKAQGPGVDPVYAAVPAAKPFMIWFSGGSAQGPNEIRYYTWGKQYAVEAYIYFRFCRDVVVKNLAVNVPHNSLSITSYVIIRRNQVDTILEVEIPPYQEGNLPINTNSVSFTSADVLSIKVSTKTAPAGESVGVNGSFEVE